ncbi:MAG: hypothetical protein WD690_07180 [Vicinamibacterales bacterium]
MARIVPSTIRQFIQDEPALANCADQDPKKQPQLGHLQAFELSALLHLLDAMPEELMPTDPDRYMDLVLGMNAIKHAVEVWRSGDQKTILKPLKRWGGLNAVALVMKGLSAAPDEAPALTTKGLPFIPDAADRTALQNDIAGVERAIQTGEWKAATVLAGSIIEALLLWALSQDAKSALGAAAAPKGKNDLGRWDLADLIRVAGELKVIGNETAKQADLARDYRNLIHPAVAVRRKMVADRPTAFGAFAGMDLIAGDLGKHFAPSKP